MSQLPPAVPLTVAPPATTNQLTAEQEVAIAQELASRHVETKKQIVALISVLTDLENQMSELSCIVVKDEGSKTSNIPGYKIETKANVYRNVNQAKWAEIEDQIPAEMRPVKTKVEAVTKDCKAYAASGDDTMKQWWAFISQAITTTKGKTSFTVTEK